MTQSDSKWTYPRSSDGSKHRLRVDDRTSRRMGSIARRDTQPERIVRRALHARGLRFRIECRELPGSPDIANRSRRWAVFVNGCFWNRHPGCRLATTPKRNRAFWLAKFARNQKRDAAAVQALEAMGFEVITIWECETRHAETLEERLESLLVSPAQGRRSQSARRCPPGTPWQSRR